jgi:hypothetical protein
VINGDASCDAYGNSDLYAYQGGSWGSSKWCGYFVAVANGNRFTARFDATSGETELWDYSGSTWTNLGLIIPATAESGYPTPGSVVIDMAVAYDTSNPYDYSVYFVDSANELYRAGLSSSPTSIASLEENWTGSTVIAVAVDYHDQSKFYVALQGASFPYYDSVWWADVE